MDEDEEKQLVGLRKEMDEVGAKGMERGRVSLYISLRKKQKSERRAQQEKMEAENRRPALGSLSVLWGLLPFIIIALIVWAIMGMNGDDLKSDCVIGRDSPDCLEGGGSGHPLWNN